MGPNDWRLIPPSKREIFNLKDITDETNHFLSIAMRTGLSAFALEVYQVPGEETCRFHFYFHLNESIQFRDVNGEIASILGLAMWMECQEPRVGELTVRFVIESRPFYEALASFQFPLKNAWRSHDINTTLLTIVNVIQGIPQELCEDDRFDLTKFRFWPMGDVTRGYRDVLSQWMVRLSNNGFVGWCAYEHTTEEVTFLEDYDRFDENDLASQSFASLIKFEYTTNRQYDEDDFLIVNMKVKKIRRGVWVSRDFERVFYHNGDKLPYEGPLAWMGYESDSDDSSDGGDNPDSGVQYSSDDQYETDSEFETVSHGDVASQYAYEDEYDVDSRDDTESHYDTASHYEIQSQVQFESDGQSDSQDETDSQDDADSLYDTESLDDTDGVVSRARAASI
ncbi:hypothetical protein FLAG1_05770 [Fusarium langsethiae]|uniref:Uncharacterized protein n=1 Tax=Fusarium langsethiae TaxID=179993 RepID=A0A0M9EWG8_FUSLA|nr:hypothetical protein FLAG1_05770 [Fusarium langsethiae]GKU03690.1 unnamed protein product [Fusarium langsethiae]GKU19048.1 unnamed protein product [Fusarium langsethiae]